MRQVGGSGECVAVYRDGTSGGGERRTDDFESERFTDRDPGCGGSFLEDSTWPVPKGSGSDSPASSSPRMPGTVCTV